MSVYRPQYVERALADQGLSGVRSAYRTACPLGLRELFEQRLGLRERQARVGDALAVGGRAARHVVLTPLNQMTLEHRAENLARAAGDLRTDGGGDIGLLQMILEAVAVGTV